jgi:hypothetical protein
MKKAKIQQVVLPNNLGTLDILNFVLTVDNFNSDADIKIRYVLSSSTDYSISLNGMLTMTFDVYATMSTDQNSLFTWICDQLGVVLVQA